MGEIVKPEGLMNRAGSGLVSSALFGAMVGAVEAMWTDTPAVKKEARMSVNSIPAIADASESRPWFSGQLCERRLAA